VFRWEERKAWKDLVRGYLQSFTRADQVSLVIKTHLRERHVDSLSTQRRLQRQVDEYAQSLQIRDPDDLPHIHVLAFTLPTFLMPRLYKVYCFLSPSFQFKGRFVVCRWRMRLSCRRTVKRGAWRARKRWQWVCR